MFGLENLEKENPTVGKILILQVIYHLILATLLEASSGTWEGWGLSDPPLSILLFKKKIRETFLGGGWKSMEDFLLEWWSTLHQNNYNHWVLKSFSIKENHIGPAVSETDRQIFKHSILNSFCENLIFW